MFKTVLYSLIAGALAVSLAEYLLHYNLIDLVVEKAVAVYHALRGK